MARSLNTKSRTVGKRRHTDRTAVRSNLRRGEWDFDTFAPTHTFRTGVAVD